MLTVKTSNKYFRNSLRIHRVAKFKMTPFFNLSVIIKKFLHFSFSGKSITKSIEISDQIRLGMGKSFKKLYFLFFQALLRP